MDKWLKENWEMLAVIFYIVVLGGISAWFLLPLIIILAIGIWQYYEKDAFTSEDWARERERELQQRKIDEEKRKKEMERYEEFCRKREERRRNPPVLKTRRERIDLVKTREVLMAVNNGDIERVNRTMASIEKRMDELDKKDAYEREKNLH